MTNKYGSFVINEEPVTTGETLLKLYADIGDLHSTTMYEGADPHGDYNQGIRNAQEKVWQTLTPYIEELKS